jgi:uncharacterized membrane protein YphA (DoxX/SURF4 family)
MKKKAAEITILLFGLFYLFSGIIKIIDIDNFIYIIRSYEIKQLIYLAPALPIVEILIGLMLVFRIKVKEVLFFSISLLLFFTAIFSYGNFFLNIDDCGCFGGIDFLKMSPVIFYLRNGVLIFLSIYLFNSTTRTKKDIKLIKFLFIVAILVISSIIVGNRSELKLYLKDTPYTRSTIDEYHDEFLNKNINETILSQYVQTSKDSTYLIFIFSYNCPHCIISSFYLNEYTSNNLVDKVIGITKGTRKEERFYKKNVKTSFEYKKIKYAEIKQITAFYPLSFYVENDTIRFKVKGALPKYDLFKNSYLDKQIESEN